jgi:hypothetical protein
MRLGDERKGDELRRKGGFELKLGEAGMTLVSRLGGALHVCTESKSLEKSERLWQEFYQMEVLSGRLSDPT